MNGKQMQRYRARMAVAQIFRSFINRNDERARFLKHLQVDSMPVIIPALGETPTPHIREAAQRYFDAGHEYVVVPVGLFTPHTDTFSLCVLIFSVHKTDTFWQLAMDELHDNTDMAQIVEALTPDKKWDVGELDSTQAELQEMAATG